jgi:hypothetical protein
MSDDTIDIKFPTDKQKLYIPIYTYDGVNWKALEPSFVLHAAKSRLRSEIPQAWKIKAMPENYKHVRCGFAIVNTRDIEEQSYFLEFSPDDLLNDKLPLG